MPSLTSWNDLGSLFRWDGSDADWLHFSTPSWTRKAIRHDLHVSKRDGEIVCHCEDCVTRRKRANLMSKNQQEGCKHIKVFRLLVFPHIKEFLEAA